MLGMSAWAATLIGGTGLILSAFWSLLPYGKAVTACLLRPAATRVGPLANLIIEVDELSISTTRAFAGEPVVVEGWVANHSNAPQRVSASLIVRETRVIPMGQPIPSKLVSDALVIRSSSLRDSSLPPGERRWFRLIFEVKRPVDQSVGLAVVAQWRDDRGLMSFRSAELVPEFWIRPPHGLETGLWALDHIPALLRMAGGLLLIVIAAVPVSMERRRRLVYALVTLTAVVTILILPFTDLGQSWLGSSYREWLIGFWIVVPALSLVAFSARQSRLLAGAITVAAYAECGLATAARVDTGWLILPVMTILAATLIAGMSIHLTRGGRTSVGAYLMLASVSLLAGTGYSLVFAGAGR